MKEYLIQLVKISLDTPIFLVIYAAALDAKIKDFAKKLPLFFIGTMVLSLLIFYPNASVIINILGMVYLYLYCAYLFDVPFQTSLYCLSFAHVLISLVSVVILLIMLCFTTNPFAEITPYIIQPIIFTLAMIFKKTGHINKLYNELVIKHSATRNIIVVFFLFTLSMTVYNKMSVKNFMDSLILILFVILITLFLYTGLYKSYKDLEESKKRVLSYEQYLPIIENLIDQVRMRQHDFNNELQAIGALTATCTDYESLKSEIEKELHTSYTERDIKNRELLKINMKLIAGFLVKSVQEAKELEYELNVDIRNMHLVSKAPEFELLDVLSILTDNAFEASKPGDHITISIDSDGERAIIELSNPGPVLTAQMRESFFSKGYSTKKEKNKAGNRGLGLYKLKQLVKKYDGAVALDNEERDGISFIKFSVKI